MASLKLLRLVKEGQYVKEGDSVAVLVSNQVSKEIIAETSVLEKVITEMDLLMAPPKQEAVAEAQAQVTAARAKHQQRSRELERTAELTSKNLITKSELEVAQSAVSIAAAELKNKEASLELLLSGPRPEEIAVLQAEIDKQEAKLAFLRSQQAAQTIRAPMSGRVDLGVDEDVVLTIVDDHEIELLVPVSDFDVNLVTCEQIVRIKVRSHADEVFVGRVAVVPLSAQFADNKAVFSVSVVVDNKDGRLRRGMTGFAKIECGESSLLGLIGRKIASEVRVEFWSWW
jgi:multidrug efflux pump subunit AcrA (membrane-fusion protein)